MEGAACEDAEPIFELAVRCERLYTEQIARLNEDSRTNGAAILSELNQRFAAWAASLGVFAESKVCLDRRLRHHVEIQEQVLRLLDIMERNLAFVCEADNTPGPMEVEHPDEPQHLGLNIENLEAISEAIERLNNIGIAIRQSSVTSHTAKARGFAETFDFTSFEGFAYIALKTMYVAASEELLGLLTRSMTETYALFLHRKSRHEKLQAPRSQPQTPVPLHTISEESAADADAGSRMNLDPQLSQQSRNSTNTRLRPLPPSLQVPKTTPRSEPTSVDSQEAKARIRKKLSPSIKGATKSILWFEYMLTTHGLNWYLEAYAPSSWICPLCNDDDTTFSIPGDLASHFADSHGKTFTQPQIQAIMQQSQIRSLRPRNECPLCCLSIEAQQDSLSKEKSKGKEEESTSKESRGDADVDRSHKRIRIEAGYTELDQHIRGDGQRAPMEQQQQKQKAQANPPATQHLTAESIASHIAGHLQAIMALTLRMISIDVPIGVSADNQSVGGGTDDHLSRAGSIQRNLDQESDIMEDIQMPEDGYVNPDDCPRPEEIPDSEEHFNWNNMRPDNEGSVVDDFLHRVIDSVAFRSHLGKGEEQDPTQMSNEDLELLQNFRTTDPRDDKRRIEHTKGGLLRDSYYWILDNADFRRWRNDGETRLLWIKGNPGMGKTMLLCGLIDELKKSTIKTAVLSFFFCQATDSRINNATAVLRGLVYLLVKQQPSFISHIRKMYDYAGKALFEDANSWLALSNILADILQDPSLDNTYLITDALDECIVDLPKLLLDKVGSKVRLYLELNVEFVSAAVNIYIRYRVHQLAQMKKYDNKTRDFIHDYLSTNANGTFFWVVLVCDNLQQIPQWQTRTKLNEFPPGLDSLYARMMEQICELHDSDLYKRILARVALVYRPITLTELTFLVEKLEDVVRQFQVVTRYY
ncbi:hypothetical protein B7494_g5907 [Chlorociboria aeruginascens]|nr:hypothetical protein B7494_g5907 [Chlorociboria aeruginascens]